MDDRSASAIRDLDDYGVAESLTASDGAEPLFVINLCAAMTPQSLDDTGIPGLDRYKLYQVSRMEDGRRRYRLRLGFFTTEADAEDVLVSVRSRYATAFTACLCDEDLKHASGYLKRSIQDLARTGRFKISGAVKKVEVQKVEVEKAAKPAVAPVKTAPANSAASAPVARPVAPQAANKVAALETPKSLAQEIAKEALQKSAPVKAAPAPAPTPIPAAPKASAAKAAPAVVEQNKHIQQVKAQISSLDDTSTGIEITWVPDKLDASPATPVGSSVPRTTAAAVPPVSPAAIAPVKAAANAPVGKLAASAKTAPTPPPAVNVAAAKSAAQALTLEKAPAPPAPAKPSVPANTPFRVGAGVKIADVGLSLATDTAAPKPAATTTSAPVKPAVHPAPKSVPAAAAPAKPAVPNMPRPVSSWRNGGDDVPTLDTTQTIRDITQGELDDVQGLKWFVVQLALSEQPFNLDAMPRLDIFEAYRLYSVALTQDGSIRHALRLGFFSEEVSADAVLGYLKTFFHAPVVERISVAEHKRFSELQQPTAAEPLDAKASARVITLEEKRAAPPTTLSELRMQTAAQKIAAHKPAERAKTPKTAKSVPTVHEAVGSPRIVPTSTTMYRTSGKYAAPAVKRFGGAVTENTPRKSAKGAASSSQQDLLEEARALGLSDTQIIRVQKNPSLLSRLVGKLTK